MKLTTVVLSVLCIFFSITGYSQSWEEVSNGLTNTYVLSLAINSDGYLFAGTYDCVFRSIDNGDSWTHVSNGLTSNSVVLDLDINSSGHIFAGMWMYGVYRSTDNGDNWTWCNNGIIDTNIFSLVINSNDDIFVGSATGKVYRSTDNGDSWTDISSGMSTGTAYDFVFNYSGDVFAGHTGGVYRSIDNGDSWTEVINGIPPGSGSIVSLGINSSDVIYAGTFGSGAFCSIDNGDNWEEINTGMAGTKVHGFAINSDTDIFAGTIDGGVFHSLNGCDSWRDFSYGLTNEEVFSLLINYNEEIFAGTTDGIFRSSVYLGCIDIRGNADGDENESVNISDITYLVAYCFGGGPAPLCIEEGNVNGDDNETINISDITYLVAYCFGGGPEPLPCPGTSPPSGHVTDYTTCKDFTQTMAGEETPPDQDCIEYKYNGAGTLSIKHVNAGLNCCPIIVADISIEDNTILIDEIDSLDNGGCYCLCLYDINYAITNLTPGEYRIVIEEPYLIEGDEKIDFTVDLYTDPSGSHCVTRNHYPWE